MSLLLNPLPDPYQRSKDTERELSNLRKSLALAEEELRKERLKNAGIIAGVNELRHVLNPLYQALQRIYGEFDGMGMEETILGATPQKKAVWEDWKKKLDPQCAKAIDALLLHGEMNQTQLRLHIKCAKGSTPGIVFRLNRAGLINKNGGRISLKEI
jgi:hypothetical protein